MSTSSLDLESIEPRPVKVTPKLLKVTDTEKLTKKQKMFCERYLVHDRPRKAAIEAGYSEATADSVHATVLKSPAVIKELRRRRTEWLQNEERNTDWAKEELAIRVGNIDDFLEVDPDTGKVKVELRGRTKEQKAAIKKLSFDVNSNPVLEMYDAKPILELILKVNGALDSTDQNNNNKGQFTVQSIDETLRQYRAQQVTINNQYNIVQSQERQKLPEIIEAQ